MIKEFRGKTKWLSNFSPVKIVIDGIEYPSTEHAYMSAKCANPTWKKVCANETITCGQIKFLGSTVKLVDEGNNWGDLIWGVDIETGEGQNLLGKLIMEFRETLIMEFRETL